MHVSTSHFLILASVGLALLLSGDTVVGVTLLVLGVALAAVSSVLGYAKTQRANALLAEQLAVVEQAAAQASGPQVAVRRPEGGDGPLRLRS